MTQNGKVVRETITTDGTVTTVMDFIYDASGRPFALIYTNGTAEPVTYYYLLNIQGDVVALINASGAYVAQYTYDAWGNTLTSSSEMAEINPLRYRGYYYDSETGFYYLQSRYYDPVSHRFINADSLASTGQGFVGTNMFVYCLNNPVMLLDETGEIALTLAQLRKIHNEVADRVANSLGGVREVYIKKIEIETGKVKVKRGFLDVYIPSSNTFYEIKSHLVSNTKATRSQLDKYRGSTAVRYDSAPITDGTAQVQGSFYFHGWKIKYESVAPGLVTYTYTPPNIDPKASLATIAVVGGVLIMGFLFSEAGGDNPTAPEPVPGAARSVI